MNKTDSLFNDKAIGYCLLRTMMGINFLIHGLPRLLGNYSGFVSGVVKEFQQTVLPIAMVQGFAGAIPLIEVVLGICLFIGLKTRWASIVGMAFITCLITGMGLQQKWDVVGIEMLYSLFFYVLLIQRSEDRLSIDGLLLKKL